VARRIEGPPLEDPPLEVLRPTGRDVERSSRKSTITGEVKMFLIEPSAHQGSPPPPSHATMEPVRTQVVRYGDSALAVLAHGGTGEDRWHAMQSLADFVDNAELTGVAGVVATFDAVLIEFDFQETTFEHLKTLVRAWQAQPLTAGERTPRRLFRVPVRYGGEFGPDLDPVAAELGISADEVVELHSSATWTIRFLGAPAGAPLHDGSPFARPIPRCATPRTRVPGGSVALSGMQGVIYPVESPGGWRLIGRTPWRLADFSRLPFAAHRPGDLLSFQPVSGSDEFDTTPTWIEVDR
jgi:KipI family sensor histidine kinase inhibitor